jgi:two-component system sensor histidine kinase MprB
VRLSLRARITAASAVIVAATLLLGSIVAFVAVRATLRGQVDDQLWAQAHGVQRVADDLSGLGGPGAPVRIPVPPPRQGGPGSYVQAVAPSGQAIRLGRDADGDRTVEIPVGATDRAIAGGQHAARFVDRHGDDGHLRVLTAPLAGGGAVQVARPLASVDAVLRSLRWVLALLVVGGTALAAALTRLSARGLVAPIADVTEAAGHIEATGDLGRRLAVTGDDEVARMAERFNAMLDALARSNGALGASLERQRRLVADASHELRTPVTSLRTNLEVLRASAAELPEADRRALVDDLEAQAEELGVLVGDLMELAREGDAAAGSALQDDVRLDEVVAEALERARRHHPRATWAADLEPALVRVAPDRLGRAVNNLLDNAATHGGGQVEVAVRGGELHVRDHGPGVADDELPYVFDRFWRGAQSRAGAGTGLGLAIVQQVAVASGGSVEARTPDGGGLEVVLRLPGSGPGALWGSRASAATAGGAVSPGGVASPGTGPRGSIPGG